MIDRVSMRSRLYRILQTEYVALLGQRGSGVKTAINTIMYNSPLFPDMKFISVALPRGMRNVDEFKELFLLRLIEAVSNVPLENELANNVLKSLQGFSASTVDFRLHRALDSLGKGTTARYLVIVLH